MTTDHPEPAADGPHLHVAEHGTPHVGKDTDDMVDPLMTNDPWARGRVSWNNLQRQLDR